MFVVGTFGLVPTDVIRPFNMILTAPMAPVSIFILAVGALSRAVFARAPPTAIMCFPAVPLRVPVELAPMALYHSNIVGYVYRGPAAFEVAAIPKEGGSRGRFGLDDPRYVVSVFRAELVAEFYGVPFVRT